jgi:TRAP-type mannitol/chloroaromatic compound transport system permease small subunit
MQARWETAGPVANFPFFSDINEGAMSAPAATHNQTPVPISDAIDNFIRRTGNVICWTYGVLIFVIILQIIMRYGFGNGLIVLEELQWHLYAVGVMFGVAYAQANDSHIRVDIVHMRLSRKSQRIWEIFGICFFVLPFVWVVFYNSLDFVYESWRVGETSDAPLGLSHRWLIKSVIPISFGLLGLAALSRLWRTIVTLKQGAK